MTAGKSPQEKKRLSYLKDRRNAYGERGACSRYAIRRNKDIVERHRRHCQSRSLKNMPGAWDEAELAALEDAILASPAAKKKFRKMPDAPLGETVAGKLAYRQFKGMGAKKKIGRILPGLRERGG